MFSFLKNWFSPRGDNKPPRPKAPSAAGETARTAPAAPPAKAKTVRAGVALVEGFTDDIDDLGPGKNVLAERPLYTVESGTYETLKIVDGPTVESDDEEGIDPYNTGSFDRSRNWDKRFLK